MRESLIREVAMDYETLRAQNREEEARRLSEASRLDAGIGGLVTERLRLFQRGARNALDNPVEAEHITAELTGQIMAIHVELRRRLKAAGLPEDYLQPVYHCEKCRDTGYVGEPIQERCECFDRRLRGKVSASAGSGLDARETFEAYDDLIYADTPLATGTPEDTQRKFMRRVRMRCETYAAQYPQNERRNMLIFGMSGLGKTYMLNCIGNRLRENGTEALKLTAYKLAEIVRASVFDRQVDGFTMLLEVPVLLLDDLGVEPLYNNMTIEHLFTLLNERQLAGLHTVISTNLALEELRGRYTERVSSRLFDRRNTLIMQLFGADVRTGIL